MDSKMFHQRAQDCLRLADECPDLYAREALVELADEFKQMGQMLEAEARTRTRARRRDQSRDETVAHRQFSAR